MVVVPVVHDGAVVVHAPQSATTRSSWPRRAVEPVGLAVFRVKSPASEPVLVMSTVPLLTSPGLRPLAVNSAVEGELPIDSVPVVKTLPGLAADAVKFAPEPTV